MRLFAFILASIAYGVLAYIAFIIFILQCGLGPDSSAACDARVDRQLPFFVAALAIGYIVGSILFWRRRAKGQS